VTLAPNPTPGGCRTDNYRALAAAGWSSASPTWGVVRFWDNSIYAMTPTSEAEWRVKVLESDDPGCWLNQVLMQRHSYRYFRLPTFPSNLTAIRVWRD
jgi:hypothetical protein